MSPPRKNKSLPWLIISPCWKIMCMGLFLASSLQAQAQKSGISASVGIASQRMDDLKYIQQYILGTYPLEGNITSSFPPFTRVSVSLLRQLYDYLQFGGGYTFSTTGGKSSYADYTGSISTEIGPTSHRLGGYVSYAILEREYLGLSLYGRADLNLSMVYIESTISILGNINRIYNHYRSLSPSGTAGIELMYKFRDFSLGVDAGYLVDLQGKLRDTDGDNDLTDPMDRNRVLTTDWTGWHVGIRGQVWLKF